MEKGDPSRAFPTFGAAPVLIHRSVYNILHRDITHTNKWMENGTVLKRRDGDVVIFFTRNWYQTFNQITVYE